MDEDKLDFSQEPIKIELGYSLISIVMEEKLRKKFLTSLEEFRKEVKKQEKINLPELHIWDNGELSPIQYRIIIFGKVTRNIYFYHRKNLEKQVLDDLRYHLSQNLFYFKEDFKDNAEKLNIMLHEQSREAYQFLYRYYTNIEPDKKKAFHWLKKLSYFECPNDIRALASCYANGDGCEQDWIQNDKLNIWLKRRYLSHILKGSNNKF